MHLTVKEILLFFGRRYGCLLLLIKGVLYIYLLSHYYLYNIMTVSGVSHLHVRTLFRYASERIYIIPVTIYYKGIIEHGDVLQGACIRIVVIALYGSYIEESRSSKEYGIHDSQRTEYQGQEIDDRITRLALLVPVRQRDAQDDQHQCHYGMNNEIGDKVLHALFLRIDRHDAVNGIVILLHGKCGIYLEVVAYAYRIRSLA